MKRKIGWSIEWIVCFMPSSGLCVLWQFYSKLNVSSKNGITFHFNLKIHNSIWWLHLIFSEIWTNLKILFWLNNWHAFTISIDYYILVAKFDHIIWMFRRITIVIACMLNLKSTKIGSTKIFRLTYIFQEKFITSN